MPITIYFLVRGRANKDNGRVEFQFPSNSFDGSTDLLADALALAVGVAGVISPLMTGGFEKAGISFDLDLPSTAPALLSDIRDKARFLFRADGTEGEFPKQISLPTYDENYTVDGSKLVDLADADVEAFTDMMIDGITPVPLGATYYPCDSRGYDIISVDTAIEE